MSGEPKPPLNQENKNTEIILKSQASISEPGKVEIEFWSTDPQEVRTVFDKAMKKLGKWNIL